MSGVTLQPVLYYTPNDPYSVDVDNRPIYNLSTNISSVAASLVGSGYGEHVSISGGLLTPGKVVRLLDNNMIKYPDASDIADKAAIYGILIGRTAGGLNKVIWNSGFLDLSDLNLAQLVSGSIPGYYIEATFNPQAATNFRIVETPADKSHVVGRVLSATGIVAIGGAGLDETVVASSNAGQANYHNLLGLSRMRNLVLMGAADASPVQYEKRTVYQQTFGTAATAINPVRAQLTSTGSIAAATNAAVSYDTTAYAWKLKEVYSQLLVGGTDAISGSSWPTTVYSTRITTPSGTGTAPSFELQKIGDGPDYTETTNINLYKQFTVTKYYQYAFVSPGTPTYGKVAAAITVFDPEGINKGGEASKMLVFDFYDYDLTSGLEIKRRRAVITGVAAVALYDNTSIIPATLKAL